MIPADQVESLIVQLGSFRTRAKARRRLAEIGPEVASRVLEVARDGNAPVNARWAALALLGEWKYKPAAFVLLQFLTGDLQLCGEAVRALQAITGLDIGEDAEAWNRALTGGAPAADAGTQLASVSAPAATDLAAEVLKLFRAAVCDVATELTWEPPGYLYLRIPLEGARKQQILVTLDAKDAAGETLATFYTECGAPTPQALQVISRKNLTVVHGKFVVDTEEDGTRKVLMRYTVPFRKLSPELTREIVLGMAQEGDALEYEIGQSDRI